jgi:hypothetical protein
MAKKLVNMKVDEKYFNLFEKHRKEYAKEIGVRNVYATDFSKILAKKNKIIGIDKC